MLRNRATALRSLVFPVRLSQLEMIIGCHAYCKMSGKFYHASNAIPRKKWHIEFWPQSLLIRDQQDSVYIMYEVLSNGAGHWRYIDVLDSNDVAVEPAYTFVVAAPPPISAPKPTPAMPAAEGKVEANPSTPSRADKKESDKEKKQPEATPSEVKTTDGDFIGHGGVAIEGAMLFNSLVAVRGGARLSIFGECPTLVAAPKNKKKATSGGGGVDVDDSRRGMRIIIGLAAVVAAKKNGLASLHIWTVPDGAVLVRRAADESSASSSEDSILVPPITRLPWAKINVQLLLLLSKSPVVTIANERRKELTVMRNSWLTHPRGAVKPKPGSFFY